jgi:hypothetical protein
MNVLKKLSRGKNYTVLAGFHSSQLVLLAIKQGFQCTQEFAYNYFVAGEDEYSRFFCSWQYTSGPIQMVFWNYLLHHYIAGC